MGNVTRADSRGICRDTERGRYGEKKKRQQVSKKERKNKGYKEAKKETKSYHSVDFLFLDFWAVSYLRVDICGVSKLTGMPVGFLLCTSAESI